MLKLSYPMRPSQKPTARYTWAAGQPKAAVPTWSMLAARLPEASGPSRLLLLHVHHLAIQERHLQVFVNVNLLRTEIHHLRRLAHRSHHLIRGHPHLDGLRLSLGLLLLSALLSAALLLPLLLLIPALLIAALRLLLRIVADGQQLADRVLDIAGACLRQ